MDLGKGGRLRVALGPGGGEVECDPLGQTKASSPESRVGSHRHLERLTQMSSDGDGIRLDDEIDVESLEAEEQIPNISSHSIDGRWRSDPLRGLKRLSDFRMELSKLWEVHQADAIVLVKAGV